MCGPPLNWRLIKGDEILVSKELPVAAVAVVTAVVDVFVTPNVTVGGLVDDGRDDSMLPCG